MNADGSEERNISNSPSIDYAPDWQPVPSDLPPDTPPLVGENGKIAFTTARDENFEVYAANEDGTGLARLTSNNASDTFPRWSPDGTRVAFLSDRGGNGEIYLMNTDGFDQKRLTNNTAADYAYKCSPDVNRLPI